MLNPPDTIIELGIKDRRRARVCGDIDPRLGYCKLEYTLLQYVRYIKDRP